MDSSAGRPVAALESVAVEDYPGIRLYEEVARIVIFFDPAIGHWFLGNPTMGYAVQLPRHAEGMPDFGEVVSASTRQLVREVGKEEAGKRLAGLL
jgi:hypothetical protein